MNNKIIERVEYPASNSEKYGSAKITAMIEDTINKDVFHKIEYKIKYLSSDRRDNYSLMLYSKEIN
jgi:hypothetical protein